MSISLRPHVVVLLVFFIVLMLSAGIAPLIIERFSTEYTQKTVSHEFMRLSAAWSRGDPDARALGIALLVYRNQFGSEVFRNGVDVLRSNLATDVRPHNPESSPSPPPPK